MPLFSIVIPSYNRREKLINAIDSVLAQDCRDFELIVVDDGSTDGTESVETAYHGKIRYIYQENRGVSSARNRGIAESRSPYIALLDSDDTWNSSKLRRDSEFINSNPGILIHQSEDIWIRNCKRVNPGNKHLKTEGDIFSESLRLCMISPSSVVFSDEIIERYGLFDELLPACEDYDLWLRITPFERIGLIREKLITRHAGHNDQLSSLHPLMDRFRLYSIMKLLDTSGEKLKPEQREEALSVAIEKARILMAGSRKRENQHNVAIMEDILSSLEHGVYKKKNYLSLLQLQPRP
ncbi:MAG TPA: glycosyltransferase [Spirochaetota bacterium]|nr:glycosyltransferase [Spirochaetota bacterium]HPJ34050.1 glycosyltransferase [Spirochaetota bacterium]